MPPAPDTLERAALRMSELAILMRRQVQLIELMTVNGAPIVLEEEILGGMSTLFEHLSADLRTLLLS